MIYFTEDQINKIIEMYQNGQTLLSIGSVFNVSRVTIQKVLVGNYPAYTGKKRAKEASIDQKKTCSKCGKELLLKYFNVGNSLYGRRSFCRECEHIIQNTPEALKRRRDLEKIKRQSIEYVIKSNKRDRDRRVNNTISYQKYLLRSAKRRAKLRNLDFNITIDDIPIPDKCPLLGITLIPNTTKASDNSPSLDRIIPSLGYIKGNVWIISYRANKIKNDASLEELETIVNNLKSKIK